MKNILFFILAFSIAFSSEGQHRLKLKNANLVAKLNRVQPINDSSSNKNSIKNSSNAATTIGASTYDYHTNASMPRHLFSYPNRAVTASWNGSNQTANYTDRGTYVNTNNGTIWNSSPTTRIQNKIAGWNTLAVTTNTEHIIAEPNLISSNSGFGTAFDTGRTFTTLKHLRGPHAAASGQNIHVVMASPNYDSTSGFIAPIYYTRSTNAGITFQPMSATFAQAAGYDTSKHAGNVGPNAYCIDAYNNIVAILIVGPTEDIILLKSLDNGLTWNKTIIREFPIKKYKGGITDKNNDGIMDTVLGCTGDASVAISYDGTVHVVFSDLQMFAQDTGDVNVLLINNSDYMNYWNDKNKVFIIVPTLIDYDGDGIFSAGSKFLGPNNNIRYGNAGYSFNPQISIDRSGDNKKIYLMYVSVYENDTSDLGIDFRNVSYVYGVENGSIWACWTNISHTQNIENTYLSTASTIGPDDMIHLIWQQDFEPGNAVQNQHDDGPSDIIYDIFDINILFPCFGHSNSFNKYLENVLIYPNPGYDLINLEITNAQPTETEIKIINVFGQVLYIDKINLLGTKNYIEINTSEFNRGLYFVQINTKEERLSQKIILH